MDAGSARKGTSADNVNDGFRQQCTGSDPHRDAGLDRVR